MAVDARRAEVEPSQNFSVNYEYHSRRMQTNILHSFLILRDPLTYKRQGDRNIDISIDYWYYLINKYGYYNRIIQTKASREETIIIAPGSRSRYSSFSLWARQGHA